MAFKNGEALRQMMKKTPETEAKPETVVPASVKEKSKKEEKKAAVPKKAAEPVIKKVGEQVMKDKNGVSFLQKAAFKRTAVLNIRLTEETKGNIDILAKKYGLSQSDLITALVANAMQQEAKASE